MSHVVGIIIDKKVKNKKVKTIGSTGRAAFAEHLCRTHVQTTCAAGRSLDLVTPGRGRAVAQHLLPVLLCVYQRRVRKMCLICLMLFITHPRTRKPSLPHVRTHGQICQCQQICPCVRRREGGTGEGGREGGREGETDSQTEREREREREREITSERASERA